MTIVLSLLFVTLAAAQAADPPGRRVEPPPPVIIWVADLPKGRWSKTPAWSDSRHHGIAFNADQILIDVERFDDASGRGFSVLMQIEGTKAGQDCGGMIYSLYPQDIAAVPVTQRAALWRRHLASMVGETAACGVAAPPLPMEPVVSLLSD